MDVTVERLRPSAQAHLELIPNINTSGRTLPDAATKPDPRTPARIDRELPSRRLSDREVHAVNVEVTDADLAAFPGLTLTVDFAPQLFTLLNQSLAPLGSATAVPGPIDLAEAKTLNTKSVDGVQLFLEARTFWGAPDVPGDAARSVVFRFVDAGGQVRAERTLFGGADIRTADLVLLGDDATPERLFICDVGENGPSIQDVRQAAGAAAVPVTVVPVDVNLGDSWLQDQLQIGATGTRDGAQQTVVHLPRMVHDAALIPGTPNLRNFTDTHFPSDTIGVVKDFWEQKVPLSDGSQTEEFSVAESYIVYKLLIRVTRLLQVTFQLLRKIEGAPPPPTVPDDDFTNLYEVRKLLDETAELLRVQTRATAQQREQIAAIPNAISEISKSLARDGEKVSLLVEHGGKSLTFSYLNDDSRFLLRHFVRGLRDLHSSQNYGGNIEVSPPTSDFPDGKILTGTIPSDTLKAFLSARAPRQPLASATTDWLAVGHIDEILSFVKTAGRPQILRAAPEAALRMLERVVRYQQTGVAVTRLFRGKKWIREESAGMVDSHQPPALYRWLVTPRDPKHPNDPHGPYDIGALTATDLSTQRGCGDPAFHDDRRFLLYSRRKKISARYAAL